MRKEDISQVNEIDREAFPTQWPPPNYRRELQNQLARLAVACDDSKPIEEPEVSAPPAGDISGLANRLKRLFGREHSGTELPSSATDVNYRPRC